jgi:transposase
MSARLKGYTIWLYVDGAKWHKGEEVEAFFENHRSIHLEYLPSYQPALNAQERIWRQVRYETTTNRWFVSLDETWTVILKTTRSWSPTKIKRLCQLT